MNDHPSSNMPENPAGAATNAPSRKTRTTVLRLLLFTLLGTTVLIASSSFVVSENEHAFVLRFGKPVRTLTKSGWYFRIPSPVEKVERIDSRLQHGDIRLSETLTRDKRNVILPIFYSWRVTEPLTFFNNVATIPGAQNKLDTLITSARNSVLGNHDFEELVSAGEGPETLAGIERELLELSSQDARNHFGIELVNVGLTQIKLPQGNTEAVFRRMRSERKREASAYRAEGKGRAEEIKAEAHKERSRLLAEARKYSEETRGHAEAEAATIYAAAHGQDIEFYRFLRTLQTLRSVVDKNTTLILDTKSAPFNLLELGNPSQAPHLVGREVEPPLPTISPVPADKATAHPSAGAATISESVSLPR